MLWGAVPNPGAAPEQTFLTGQLLVATPELDDPNFYHTVVLMIQHDAGGAVGIVLNRAIGERSIAELLTAAGEDATGVTGRIRIFEGGPVEPEAGFIIHSAEYRREQTVKIDGDISVTSNPAVLRDIARSRGPKQSLVAFGYAGWGPGQLESAIAHHGWFAIPNDPKLVFQADREKLWQEALARRTYPL